MEKKKEKNKIMNIENKKNEYITCKTDKVLKARLKKAAKTEKRSISNLINFICEEWLNENEIRL